jgi:hypothetical protein
MKSDLVELHLPGGHSVSESRATEAQARLATQGYTFTMAGGTGR